MTQAVISLYVCEKSVVLERLDGRECVEQFADDHWTQLLKALRCLADKHQNVSGRQLILITEKLYQLYMHKQRATSIHRSTPCLKKNRRLKQIGITSSKYVCYE